MSYELKKDLTNLHDIDFFGSQVQYAGALAKLEAFDEAIALQNELLLHLNAAETPDVSMLANTELGMGRIYYAQKSYAEAESWFRSAARRYREDHGPSHYLIGVMASELARPLMKMGKLPEALTEVDQAIDVYVQNFGMDYLLTLNARVLKAEILLAQGDPDSATDVLLSAIDALEEKYSSNEQRIMFAKSVLGQVYLAGKRYPAADSLLHASYNYYVQSLGDSASYTIKLDEALDTVHQSVGSEGHE